MNKNPDIVINLPPRTKKNSNQVIFRGKRPFVIPSERYTQLEKDCGWFLNKWKNKNINYPINLKVYFYIEKNYKSDIVGYLQAIQDILVHYKVIEDDNRHIIQSIDGTRVFVDRKNPRIEIWFEKIENSEN